MARCGCSGATCGCVLTAGDGVTVTGAGTSASPWEISVGDPLTCLEKKAIYDELITAGLSAGPAANLSGYDGSC